MAIRLQEFLYKLEEGPGYRILKIILGLLLIFGLAVWYDSVAFKNLSSIEGMDAAQLGRNIAEGKGYTTSFIRPFSLHLVRRHAQGTDATNTAAKVPALPHPDLANPPVYPYLLGGALAVMPFKYPDLTQAKSFTSYGPDLYIAGLNQVLLALCALMVYLLGRRLFDETVGWISAAVFVSADLLWRFSISGTSTMAAMFLMLVTVWAMSRIDEGLRDPANPARNLTLFAAMAGLCLGLTMLSRYALGVLIVPLVIWFVSLPSPRKIALALTTVLVFAAVIGPWLFRNYSVSGTFFGTAGYALFENSTLFAEHELPRSLAVDFSLSSASDHWQKLLSNTRTILQQDLPRLGGSWVSAFFLVGLLVPFRNPTLSRARYFVLISLGVLIGVQALGKTALSQDSPEVNTENYLVFIAPLVFIFGVSLFAVLLDQLTTQFPGTRFMTIGLFLLVVFFPLLLVLWDGVRSPVAYPPYYPPWLQDKSRYVEEKDWMMSDIPWAVAWYGKRDCVWLPLKHKAAESLKMKNDFYRVNAIKPLAGLHLSAKTLKTIETERFLDWLKTDKEAALLFNFRQRIIQNKGEDERREEDFRLCAAVREKLVEAIGRVPEDQDWPGFMLDILLKNEVPTGFPLNRAPAGVWPELFLAREMKEERKAPPEGK